MWQVCLLGSPGGEEPYAGVGVGVSIRPFAFA